MSPLVNKDFINPSLSLDEEEVEKMIKSLKDNITTSNKNINNITYE